MEDYVCIEKNEDKELPVPTAWRGSISKIVDSIPFGRAMVDLPYLADVFPEGAKYFYKSISDYGKIIDPVSPLTWVTSIYLWMDGYWDVLVDLFSEGKRIDLVLFLRVTESDGGYKFYVESIHVP